MYIWRKGRTAGRVGSDFFSAIAARVGSDQRFAGSGRIQEKWPVDNSVVHTPIPHSLVDIEAMIALHWGYDCMVWIDAWICFCNSELITIYHITALFPQPFTVHAVYANADQTSLNFSVASGPQTSSRFVVKPKVVRFTFLCWNYQYFVHSSVLT